MDFIDWATSIFVGLCVLLFIIMMIMFSLAMGESFLWWEFNLVSDCNDYGQVCSTE